MSDGLLDWPEGTPATILIEHHLGAVEVGIDYELNGNDMDVRSAEILRTAQSLAQGEIFVSSEIWE